MSQKKERERIKLLVLDFEVSINKWSDIDEIPVNKESDKVRIRKDSKKAPIKNGNNASDANNVKQHKLKDSKY